jgi:4-aminobutyrate aminotransferase-like enzyme
VENSAKTGDYLGEQLEELQTRHNIVAATRGIGLMRAIELKKNPATGEEFVEGDDLAHRMPRLMREHGLLARAGASIQVAPPLVINREEADNLVDGLDQVIGDLEQELGLD